MHILLIEKKKTPRESAICRPEHLRTTEILARDKESNFNYAGNGVMDFDVEWHAGNGMWNGTREMECGMAR